MTGVTPGIGARQVEVGDNGEHATSNGVHAFGVKHRRLSQWPAACESSPLTTRASASDAVTRPAVALDRSLDGRPV
jgi:hypothetical protein